MAQVELLMPKMGESIFEATILTWVKKPGDKIEQDESVLEVATDKVDTEVPSTYAGTLKEILAKEGEVVKVGSPIAIIITDNQEGTTEATEDNTKEDIKVEKPSSDVKSNDVASIASSTVDTQTSDRFYSPLVKSIAKEENISFKELDGLVGTGAEGRVTKKDILDYVQNKKLGTIVHATAAVSTAPSMVPPLINAGDEIIQMDRMRKMIADRMVDSKRIAPHVTSFVEADVTSVVFWRNKVKNEFMKRDGDVLTFTPIFIEAIVMAIKDYPMINVQVDGDKIIKKKDINIGVAVALPSGNLIVPVIKNADQYTISGLAKKVNDIAKRARENKLKPDELTGGTFTVSNVGSFGNVMGTPIIMQPQVGIIALGAIQKKPSVLESPYGDTIAIRHKMFLSHSYDHRVVDGALGGSVVRRVADYLERFDFNRTI
jgi:2-oxoglutarate dehydrogenase E2 component (dihydrolipoamide succinyltransferase)